MAESFNVLRIILRGGYVNLMTSTLPPVAGQKFVITGVAGFVGSSIATRLLDNGATVIGVDCLTDYYDTQIKENNLKPLLAHHEFQFIREPILKVDWAPLLR